MSDLQRRTRVKARYKAPRPKRKFVDLPVPAKFSIINNPEEMNVFFQKLARRGASNHISLDLTGVSLITTEAIAALTAKLSSMRSTTVRGNLPVDNCARQVLLQSGFFEHVRSVTPLPQGQLGKIKERNSKQVEATTARELIECGVSQAFGNLIKSDATRATYMALIELMGNTHNHASGKRLEVEPWWATAYGDAVRKRVCYSFLDTGVGIFKSVKMSPFQRTFRKLGFGNNAQLLKEILAGLIESRTGLPYRGKGLPTIYQKSQGGDLKSLFIIANDVFADIPNGVYRTLETPFPGTLFYWECEE